MSESGCIPEYNSVLFYHLMILPAMATVAVLQVYDYVRIKRFKLVLPFKFLEDNDKNRLPIILAFGSAASTLVNIFLKAKLFDKEAHWVLNPIQNVVYVLEIGVLHFPLFSCIHSKYDLLSAIMGLLYSLLLIFQLLFSHTFINCDTSLKKHLAIQAGIGQIPDCLCLIGMVYYFIKKIYTVMKRKQLKTIRKSQSVVKKFQMVHVKNLFNSFKISEEINIFSRYIYKVDPGFKFPTLLLAATIVIVTILFQLIVESIVIVLYVDSSMSVPDSLLVIFGVTVLVTVIICVIQLLFFMKNFRADSLNTYSRFKEGDVDPHQIGESGVIRYNLFFFGYFVAFSVFGTLIIFVVVLVMTMMVYYIPLYFIEFTTLEFFLKKFGMLLYNGMFVSMILLIVHRLVIHFAFKQQKYSTDHHLFVRNIGLYHLYLYYTIFLSLLTGVLVCLWTAILSFFVNLIFIARIDRLMVNPKYFWRLYLGHLAYLSFIKVEATIKNPVLNCFCQILLDITDLHQSDIKMDGGVSSVPVEGFVPNTARNRWFLAVMLHHNPSIRKFRKHQKEPIQMRNSDAAVLL